jgi:hypothetical protein
MTGSAGLSFVVIAWRIASSAIARALPRVVRHAHQACDAGELS